MVPYSIDLRERVLAAVDAGEETQEQIAERFTVSSRWIRKLLATRRHGHRLRSPPRPRPADVSLLIKGESAEGGKRLAVAAAPDATLEERPRGRPASAVA